MQQDHPRVCGEYYVHFSLWTLKTGSSPRVRGIRFQEAALELGLRIIPACAGNTLATDRPLLLIKDHPRVCGEYTIETAEGKYQKESSPRVRGILSKVFSDAYGVRIIPACAGNTR